LVGDEWHDGEELTGDGGWRSCDPMGIAEEMADDSITWGKRSARTRRLARWKESRIGGERTVATYLCWGESGEKGRSFGRLAAFIARGERERERAQGRASRVSIGRQRRARSVSHRCAPVSPCHTPVLKEVNRSFHTCVQDIQITRTANIKVNNSQCYDYIINRVYL
jgi:hypothetical protein